MNTPKVSILVPCYNVERYINKALNSVVSQTLTDIEIICIDDGSTDQTGAILDEYAKKDPRVKVLHKENTGYGHSMNIGIKMATGEYIGIVEPDDYIAENMYELLYSKTCIREQQIDLVKANFYNFSDDGLLELMEPFKKSYLADKVIKPCNYLQTFHGAPAIWAGIYKREFLLNKNVLFLETPGASYQDTGFHIIATFEASNAIYITNPIYYYRIDNDNSSVKNNSKIFAICDEFNALEQRYNKTLVEQNILNSLKIEKYIWNYNRLNEAGRAEFMVEYQKLIRIVQDHLYYLEITGTGALRYVYKTLKIKYPFSRRIESFIFKITQKLKYQGK